MLDQRPDLIYGTENHPGGIDLPYPGSVTGGGSLPGGSNLPGGGNLPGPRP